MALLRKSKQYRKAGAHFAVWGDGPIIDASEPSEAAIRKQAKELASFATYCQSSGLVPIVYPKLSFDKPPSIVKFADLTKRVLSTCVTALNYQRVLLEGTVLMLGIAPKPDQQSIARNTFRVPKDTVPAAIPAIVFLSSGQSEEKAIIAMNKLKSKKPWKISSFFGPPLQQGTLKAGAGKDNPHSPLEAR
ncbi:fructose-bisphosphate aldolase 8, cytosolic-like [Eucalyptus grandis]|uniref:fructose-bisphosphate aldolase 8, cytosolic-like n=1 Tax=Eucalyptus grandis TaxID=71139 RepID=UPI00192ED5A1|nr:fructose-bisphosphate aldolase 8, cytosolic-like [Eucalyptus grandis]